MKKEVANIIFAGFYQRFVLLLKIVLFPGVFFLVYDAEAQRTDIMILNNGDRITGDIKRMEMGVLTIKTNDMGTLKVDWSKVKSLRTEKTYEIEMSSGMLYYTSFDTLSKPGEIALVTQFEPEYEYFSVEKSKMVRFSRLKDLILRRFSGNYSIGIGLVKADHLSKFNFGATTKYNAKKNSFQLDINSNRSSTDGNVPNLDQNVKFIYYHRFINKWIAGSSATAEQNTELGLDLRLILALSGGKFLIQTNLHRLILLGGFQGTREFTSDSERKTNLEAIFQTRYDIYKFQHPKINIGTYLTAFPSVSQFGRFRSEINLSASIELFKDFFFKVDFYFKSDNKPATEASKTDYNFNTSIAYSF